MNTQLHTKKDFLWTRWKKADIQNAGKEIIALKKKRYAEIKKIPAHNRTFENTIYALESSDYDLSDSIGYIEIHRETSTDPHIRKIAKETLERVSKQMVDIEYDEDIYRAVKEYAAKGKKLTDADKKLLKDMLLGCKRMGFDLPKEKRDILQRNIKKLNTLSTTFSHNINEYKDHIFVTREELDGLPERYIQGLGKDKKTGKYKVTLQYPDMGPFMVKAKNSAKRKELAKKALQKGGRENLKLLAEIVRIRRENAKLLGYKTHADYKTEVRTVKTTAHAFSFVNGLMKKVARGVQKDMDALAALKREETGDKRARIEHYDVAYYSDMLEQKRFSVDSEKVREYFPADTVKKGTFVIYEKLFSIKFEKMSGYPLWHEDTELYAVKEGGNIISYFALDLYPREGKYGHACAIDMVKGRVIPGNDMYMAPIAVMLANFPKPRKGHPSLLSHGEVETFFHEFGHIMHMVLTRAKYMSQSGASTAWDFVEAPSQMLEHWVWDKKMLNILSEHYKTGGNIPKELLANMIKGKFHMVHYATMRQLIFALFDLTLHTKQIKNPSALYAQLIKKYTGIVLPKEQIFPAGFGHMMGYDAGYYGYMWSKVFATDMFTKFDHAGLLNAKTGRAYRECILEKGSSEEEIKLLEEFLGRKPNNKAFLKEIGF